MVVKASFGSQLQPGNTRYQQWHGVCECHLAILAVRQVVFMEARGVNQILVLELRLKRSWAAFD